MVNAFLNMMVDTVLNNFLRSVQNDPNLAPDVSLNTEKSILIAVVVVNTEPYSVVDSNLIPVVRFVSDTLLNPFLRLTPILVVSTVPNTVLRSVRIALVYVLLNRLMDMLPNVVLRSVKVAMVSTVPNAGMVWKAVLASVHIAMVNMVQNEVVNMVQIEVVNMVLNEVVNMV